jgi:hypothetical protein
LSKKKKKKKKKKTKNIKNYKKYKKGTLNIVSRLIWLQMDASLNLLMGCDEYN